MRAAAVIQARMGSTRLPGKVLLPLAGRPLLWHVVHRLRRARQVAEVALATTTSGADDALASYAEGLGIRVFRGPEDDVLARFALAARSLEAEILVRVTGDAPLVDPGMVDRLVEALRATGADFATGAPGPCIHEGIDPFTRRVLERLVREAGQDPVAREHVTGYLKLHPGFAPIAAVEVPPEHRFAGARISVDAPADLEFLEAVYTRLGAAPGEADLADVVRLLRAEPALLAINARVRQKALDARSFRALVRCDGASDIGLGHLYRCLALAEALREGEGVGVTFAVARAAVAVERARRAGFPVEVAPGGPTEAAWLEDLARRLGSDAVILDTRTALPRAAVEALRARGALAVAIDDASERRLACDLVFAPPVPQIRELDWGGFRGELLAGFEWTLLRRSFAATTPRAPSGPAPRILLAMGGSDPAGLSFLALDALELLAGPLEVAMLVGAAFERDAALAARISRGRHRVEVVQGLEDVAGEMARADLAIASFGMTAYELAAVGTPALHLGLSPDHARSAEALAEGGASLNLGHCVGVDAPRLAAQVERLLAHPERLGAMSAAGRRLVDGRGAARTARRIGDALRARAAASPRPEAASARPPD